MTTTRDPDRYARWARQGGLRYDLNSTPYTVSLVIFRDWSSLRIIWTKDPITGKTTFHEGVERHRYLTRENTERKITSSRLARIVVDTFTGRASRRWKNAVAVIDEANVTKI